MSDFGRDDCGPEIIEYAASAILEAHALELLLDTPKTQTVSLNEAGVREVLQRLVELARPEKEKAQRYVVRATVIGATCVATAAVIGLNFGSRTTR